MNFEEFKELVLLFAAPHKIIKRKKEATLSKAIYLLLFAGIISGIISSLPLIYALVTNPSSVHFSNCTGLNMRCIIAGVIDSPWLVLALGLVAYPLLMLLITLVSNGLVLVFAKLRGAKGTYTQQTYLLAVFLFGYGILLGPLSLISYIHPPVCIIMLINVIVSLYVIFGNAIVLRDLHKFGFWTAIAVQFIGPLLLSILAFFVFYVFLMPNYVANYEAQLHNASYSSEFCVFPDDYIRCNYVTVNATNISLALKIPMGYSKYICNVICRDDYADKTQLTAEEIRAETAGRNCLC